ncbi:hypothetical protein [Streptomyces sp. V3I7]|uniref:hypothetical protein n=1 Tax=Streptomyces sp. V3I7 TaxID=3042278 RepID=UPI0027812680|nr:hypothetical protein [Streptomyces sp. V3I7]MDQ0992145.1 hypothetical protein [Streptomyces sp. V3I7]
MTTLKIAIEVAGRDGRLRDDDPNAVIHAYDTDEGGFPFHGAFDVQYIVKPDIDWARPLLHGRRCDTCRRGSDGAAAV